MHNPIRAAYIKALWLTTLQWCSLYSEEWLVNASSWRAGKIVLAAFWSQWLWVCGKKRVAMCIDYYRAQTVLHFHILNPLLTGTTAGATGDCYPYLRRRRSLEGLTLCIFYFIFWVLFSSLFWDWLLVSPFHGSRLHLLYTMWGRNDSFLGKKLLLERMLRRQENMWDHYIDIYLIQYVISVTG